MLFLIALWALAEATVFFIVVDVPIMALGIRAGVRKALLGAVLAAVVAAFGGAALWLWANTQPEAAKALVLAVPAIDTALVAKVFAQWDEGGALAMTIGSFSGEPYKIYALAAGTSGAGWGALTLFVLASILARLPRFLLVAVVAGWAGPRLTARFGVRTVWTGFALAWAAFYAWYWTAMGF